MSFLKSIPRLSLGILSLGFLFCAPLRAADEGSVVAPEIAPHVADGRAQSLDLIPEPGIFALIAAAGFLLIIRRRDR